MNVRGWNVDNISTTVSHFGFQGRFLTLVLTLVHFFIVFAFPILCCLRVDKLISSSWTLVFTPLWILDVIYYGSLLFLLIFSDGKLYTFCNDLLLFIVQVLIVIRLDRDVEWNLVTVLTPYFTYEFLSLLEAVAGGLLRDQMLVNDSVNAGISQIENIQTERLLLFKAVVRKTGLSLLRIVQALLIGMKADGRLQDASWWRVLIPVWILVVYLFWYPIKKYIESTSTYRLLDAVLTTGVVFMLVAPFFLLTERLEGKSMSSFSIVMPWMLLMGAALLFLFCAISLAGSERIIQSGVQPTRRHAQSPAYRNDYVGVDMD
ncbi:unnamed protein product [Peronospora effusa]|nr:unnamed protein product [Peronospora effusa]